MSHIFNSVFTLLVLAFLASCSSWTTDKCQNNNWDTTGYTDGSNGKNNSSGMYASKCQKKGVSINTQAYNVGYQRGLNSYCNYNKGHQTAFAGQQKEAICSPIADYNKGYSKGTAEYCTAETGYKVALDGGPEAQICSGQGATAFINGYRKGRKKFVLEEIEAIKGDLVKAKKDLDDVRDNLADKQNQLSRIPQHTYEVSVIQLREDLQNEVANLSRDRDNIKQELDKMEAALEDLEREARTK